MRTIIPEKPFRPQLEQRRCKEPAFEVDRMPHIILHPFSGCGLRVRIVTEVDKIELPVVWLINVLLRKPTILAYADAGALGLAKGKKRSRFEQANVQVTDDLQVLTGVIKRTIAAKFLGMPNLKLPGRQVPAFTIRSRHLSHSYHVFNCGPNIT